MRVVDRPSLFAYLSYRDAPAGLAFLAELGFEAVSRQDAPGGEVLHSEVRRGAAVLMVATADADYQVPAVRGRSTGGGLYLLVGDDEVDALHARAVAAGATSLIAPEATEWGSRRARVVDPEGHELSFGSYEPGVAWG